LMGMAGGALASYAAHFVAVQASVWLLLGPLTVRFLLSGEPVLGAMAFAGVIYALASYRATRMLEDSLRKSFQLTYELNLAKAQVERLAQTDELTGLNNRRAFRAQVEEFLARTRRYQEPLSLVMLDVDHFKRINDTHSHAAGDAALRAVADVLKKSVRAIDVPGRWGGEEFALALPQTGLEEALKLAERVRLTLEAERVKTSSVVLALTASFGVASADSSSTVESLVAGADAAMYRAKEQGRNRVVAFS
jgi:diguanylate cyclase